MRISDSRILVTGAGGFIGGAMAVRLAEKGAHVRGWVRRPAERIPSAVEVFSGDLADPAAIERAVQGCDAIVHAAARHITRGPRAEFDAINVTATGALLRAWAAQNPVLAPRGRFLHISTVNVLGLPPPPGASADSPLQPSGDPYSDSKIEGERAVLRAARDTGAPVTIVRPGCVYGPHGLAWTILPVQKLRERGTVLIGRGDGLCNAIFIDNLVDLLVRALECDAAAGQTFLGTEGRAVTWREFYGTYAHMLGGAPLRSIPYLAALAYVAASSAARPLGRRAGIRRADIEFHHHHVVFDIAKSRRLLGYAPAISFEEGMGRTEAWLRVANLLDQSSLRTLPDSRHI